MNKNLLNSVIVLLFLVNPLLLVAQEQKEEEPPKLEIPEITIIGKKAITLPFARKGEIYDNVLYEAPGPDSSILGRPPAMMLMTGALPRFERDRRPWRASAEGSIGTFQTGKGRLILDYDFERWGITGRAGYGTTDGHIRNANATRFEAGGDLRWLVQTDNQVLSTFRAGAGASFTHDAFGLYGISSRDVRRRNDEFQMTAKMSTLEQRRNALTLGISADFLSLKDSYPSGDSTGSVVSPELFGRYVTVFGRLSFETGLKYSGSSVDAGGTTASPSIFTYDAGFGWKPSGRWRVNIGGSMASGTGLRDSSSTLAALNVRADLDLDSMTSVGIWYKPEMTLRPFSSYFREVPYLRLGTGPLPERSPLALGASVVSRTGILTLIVNGAYKEYSARQLSIADSGIIRPDVAESREVSVEGSGSLGFTQTSRLQFSALFTSAREPGSSVQLPMVPMVRVSARGELDFHVPAKAWASAEYLGPRNADRAGNESLSGAVVIGAGFSTTIIPQTLLMVEGRNLSNTSYDWWKGYVAPGASVEVSAKVSIR